MTATNNLIEKLPLQDKRVAVAGLFRTRSGMQRGAQLMVLDLRRRGYAVNAIDLSSSLYYALDETDAGLLSPSDLERLSVRELIVHINPPLFEAALDAFPPAVLTHVRVTGYWAWELTVLSDEWRDCAKRCSAIWAPSPFLAETFAAELPDFTGEIAVIPHQVDLAPPPKLNPEERLRLRQRHDLEPTQFVCGTNFAFLSNYARKNPMGAIDAFTQAFPPEDRAARLLVRTHDSERYPELFQRLLERAEIDPRIRVFNATQRPWPVNDFMGVLDVFIALHRSEGYGLQIAEAAQAGIEVLATGWRLAPDIAARPQVHMIDYKLVEPIDPQNFYNQFPGAIWADPDLDHAAKGLRMLRAARQADVAPE